MSRLVACLLLAVSACASPGPRVSARPQLLTRADTIAAMCGHDPRVPIRLYGCYRPPGPIFLIDGVLLPSDTSRASMRIRDSVSASLEGRELVAVFLAAANDSVAMATYGSRARDGLVILRTQERQPSPTPSLDRLGFIAGEVVDARTSRPLEGAELTVHRDSSARWQRPLARSSTDSTGSGTLALREPGTYLVRVRAFGYTYAVVPVKVQRDATARVRVKLDVYRNCMPRQADGTVICM